jgi:hypothetical protein
MVSPDLWIMITQNVQQPRRDNINNVLRIHCYKWQENQMPQQEGCSTFVKNLTHTSKAPEIQSAICHRQCNKRPTEGL